MLFLCLNALNSGMTKSLATAAEGKGETPKRGGQTSARLSMNAIDNSNALWSADPERGWIRAEEKHELHDQSQSKAKSKQTREKQKGNGAKY